MRWLPLLALVAILAPGPGHPAHGNPPTAPLAAPSLGPWVEVWMGMDDKDNYVQDVVKNHRHDEYTALHTPTQNASTLVGAARRHRRQPAQLIQRGHQSRAGD